MEGTGRYGRGTTLLLALRLAPQLEPVVAAWPLEDILSVSPATPYWYFRRAAPGRVRDPTATGFAPITGSLRQGILTTPVLSGNRSRSL